MWDNLWDIYHGLECSYYGIPNFGLNSVSEVFSDKSCLSFIEQHYDEGSKKEAFNLVFQKQYQEKGKHQHTVALYLLGLHLKEQFKGILSYKINELIPGSSTWGDYKYTWFLTCLYHDTASCIEQRPTTESLTEHQKTLDFYLKEFDVTYTPFNYVPIQLNVSLTRFPEPLVKNYFHYRMHDNKLDHGIMAGYILFDRLYKNFSEKTKNKKWGNNKKVIIDGLYYRPEHLDHFAYIADAIICHNIWTASEPKYINIYKNYGLEPLIVEGNNQDKKLNIDDYPLQFLLCLLDSIEPVKRFIEEKADVEPPMKAVDVLRMFCINRAQNNTIKISWCRCLEEQKKTRFKSWLDNVFGLNKWMDVNVAGEDNSVRITINRR